MIMSISSFHCSYKKNQDKKQNWMMAEVQFSRGIDETKKQTNGYCLRGAHYPFVKIVKLRAGGGFCTMHMLAIQCTRPGTRL